MMYDTEQIAEKALFRNVETQEFRQLVQHDHKGDPRLEAGQDRRGNKVGDEPQTQQRRQYQQYAHQGGQGGNGGDQLRRIAVRNRQTELRTGQDTQGSGGANAE